MNNGLGKLLLIFLLINRLCSCFSPTSSHIGLALSNHYHNQSFFTRRQSGKLAPKNAPG